jgi:CheY-like chemotaxis protein
MPDVIVVEDNELDSMLICKALVAAGIDGMLHVATDGEQALQLFAQVDQEFLPPPALIVLDLNLPRYSGRELLAHVRSHPVLGAVPVAVVSGTLNPRERDAVLTEGANAFFMKPHDVAGFMGVGRDLVELVPPAAGDSAANLP